MGHQRASQAAGEPKGVGSSSTHRRRQDFMKDDSQSIIKANKRRPFAQPTTLDSIDESSRKAEANSWGVVSRAIRNGDADSFQILFDHFFQQVFLDAKRLSGRDEATCLDIVQETMLKVIRFLRVIDNEPQLAAWIRAVTKTTTYDWLRKEKRRRESQLPSDDSIPTHQDSPSEATEQKIDDHARLLWLEEQLADLPQDTRHMIRMRYRLGWSLKQIGERFGLNTGAVDGRIRRVVERLRKNALKQK